MDNENRKIDLLEILNDLECSIDAFQDLVDFLLLKEQKEGGKNG